ncbi:hypothetical protein CQW49_02265 [Methylosinus trichosporium OB3b]|uniref:Invasion associated locus B family protein n=1 Tax=Methylosinus trichosporium (strain ATCC 35070 / NCIMB 11131 / UNIQEM 75 / OB3b) TaxID=595536 RepID=A0A2D2CVP5_METT3|nr:hypothetical protein CQW49_02265 [Methylosinus trichosporium OB3b]
MCCAGAPALAKDKPAAEDAADSRADKKKPAKPDSKKVEAKKPDSAKPAAKKTAEVKKPNGGAGKTEAEQSEPAAGNAKHGKGKPGKDAKSEAKEKPAEKEKGASKPPSAVGTFGDWNAMTAHAQGKDKTCYALAEPKERQPAKLQRDKAYIFISTRPGEGVRNEVAIILGFPLKDGGAATAEIDGKSFELVTKGSNAWVKNPAKEKEFVDTMKSGGKLSIKAPSIKGNVTTDVYALKGLAEALARVQKECP